MPNLNTIIEIEQNFDDSDSSKTFDDFQITMSEISMFNITFLQAGYLIKIQQQGISPIQILDSDFTMINNGSIWIESSNLNTSINVIATNITVNNITESTNSFIKILENILMKVYNSTFCNINNLESGAVVNIDHDQSQIEFYNCTFTNNTAIHGSVARVSQGVAKFYECLITNNFAIHAGVLYASNNTHFEVYRSTISNNHAIASPAVELHEAFEPSIINNSTISKNSIYQKEYITEQINNCTEL